MVTFFHFAFYKQIVLVCVFLCSLLSAQQTTGFLYVQEGANISGKENISIQEASSTIEKENSQLIAAHTTLHLSSPKPTTQSKKKVQTAHNTLALQKKVISAALQKKIEKVQSQQKLATESINWKLPVSDQKIVNSSTGKDLLFTVPLQNHYSFAVIQYAISLEGIILPSDAPLCANTSTHGYQSEISFSLYNRPPPVI